MKRVLLSLLICFLFLSLPLVQAEQITFTVDQKQYYFLTGQQAIIPLTMNNSYDREISGSLSYTLTQQVQQGSGSYSTSNSQSQSFTVPKGNNTIQLNFGQSDQPLQITADLQFSFKEDGTDHLVSLQDLNIYFVSNQSQMNNKQQTQQSSSEEIKHAEPNKNTQQQPQTPQQKLQNNQLSQDSQALKKQIQQQLAEEQQQQDNFEQTLMNDSIFQQHHQDLLNQNYTLNKKLLDAVSNDTGVFNYSYENKKGESATLQGRMDNGSLQHISKQSAEDRKQMLDTLNQSTQFQRYHEHLKQEGYNQTDVSFQQQKNSTRIDISYQNKQNETATISARFEDQELKQVTLDKEQSSTSLLWFIPIIIGFMCILFLILYWYRKKNQHVIMQEPIKAKKPFDYKQEAKRLLMEAERLYRQHRFKDAYQKAGQSLRLYLSYEHGLNKELTNDDIIRFLKNKDYPYQKIKECFDLCSLVEFAKYRANETDFHHIKTTIQKTIP